MAKLNDPPAPPAESIDALKRRFIRQNREFARVNSNQSQRIRNLETEISRLLAENITLREQAISSASDAERWRTSSGLTNDIVALKDKLAAKMAEVHGMVEELGALPQKAATRSSGRTRRSAGHQDLVRSPNERDWRNRQTLGGVLNAERELQDGKLPAILEDKYYPRRTLEPAEITQMVDEVNGKKDDTESPDLGPPPVAHFDVSEPITFDSNKMPKRVSGGIIPDDEEVLTLPNNMETRRKRRTSSLLHDMTVLPEELTAADRSNESDPSPKLAAKRKLDVSQWEDNKTSTAPVDDFVFHRKGLSVSSRPKPSRFTRPQSRHHEDAVASEALSPKKSLEPARRVLASKSTNSPTKRRVASAFDKKEVDKDMLNSARSKPIHAPTKAKGTPSLRIDMPMDTDEQIQSILRHPKTPALASTELLSPNTIPTEPSGKPTAMTRSEAAITNSLEDVLNGSIGRGSRRAKAAVSYAEPNLRDKMRRPDKKLVGAVEGLKREASRDMSVDMPDSEYPDLGVQNRDVAYVKTEPASPGLEGADWRKLPMTERTDMRKEEAISPLRDKEPRQITAKMVERRHKRTFSEVEGKPIKTDHPRMEEELGKATARLSIFDPPNSSSLIEGIQEKRLLKQPLNGPLEKGSSPSNGPNVDDDDSITSTARARRHSVQAQSYKLSNLVSSSDTKDDKIASRPNSAMSMREANILVGDPASTRLKRASSAQSLTHIQRPVRSHMRVPSVPALVDSEAANGAGTRTMGTRRRSMMV